MSLVVDRPRLTSARRANPRALTVVTTLAVVGGLVARFWPRSALWLDEAQTIAIARPALRHLPSLLREDGAPPLYYAFLHLWMRLFGDGDYIVRLPSVLASLAALVVLAHLARRLFSPRAAWIAVAVAAANPFAIRYATEARMYAFVVLEVLIGMAAAIAVLAAPTRRHIAALAAVAAALVWTHYWGLYLITGTAFVMAAWWALAAERGPARRLLPDRLRPFIPPASTGQLGVVLALVLAGLAFLPWLGVFVFQSRHTATPWAQPAHWWQAFDIVISQSGGHRALGWLLGGISWALIAFAFFFHRDVPGRRRAPLLLVAVFFATAQGAVFGSISSNTAFASRYSSVLLPLVFLLVAAGVATLRTPSAQTAVLSVLAIIGHYLAQGEVRRDRTPAPRIAAALEARARPGDVVAFCPDQLGPALSRALGHHADQLIVGTFPNWHDPARVVWVDYVNRHRDADAEAFAEHAEARSGSNAVWLVWSNTYPPTESSCSMLRDELTLLRGNEETVVRAEPWRDREAGAGDHHAGLLRYA
jgi:hypothetical protein